MLRPFAIVPRQSPDQQWGPFSESVIWRRQTLSRRDESLYQCFNLEHHRQHHNCSITLHPFSPHEYHIQLPRFAHFMNAAAACHRCNGIGRILPKLAVSRLDLKLARTNERTHGWNDESTITIPRTATSVRHQIARPSEISNAAKLYCPITSTLTSSFALRLPCIDALSIGLSRILSDAAHHQAIVPLQMRFVESQSPPLFSAPRRPGRGRM